MMTALSTIAGILPIAIGMGVGGEARAPLGVAVVGGMAFSTLLTFFVIPTVYLTFAQLEGRFAARFARRGDRVDSAGAASLPAGAQGRSSI
jgi:hypothetical protein